MTSAVSISINLRFKLKNRMVSVNVWSSSCHGNLSIRHAISPSAPHPLNFSLFKNINLVRNDIIISFVFFATFQIKHGPTYPGYILSLPKGHSFPKYFFTTAQIASKLWKAPRGRPKKVVGNMQGSDLTPQLPSQGIQICISSHRDYFTLAQVHSHTPNSFKPHPESQLK